MKFIGTLFLLFYFVEREKSRKLRKRNTDTRNVFGLRTPDT